MKNKRIEQYKVSAKRYKYPSHATVVDGIRIYHDYSEPRERAYWDDFGFIRNGTYHLVLFTHPRYRYEDYCDELAYEYAKQFDTQKSNMWENATPNYMKVGKSRKKAVSWTMTNYEYQDHVDTNRFYAEWKDKTQELLRTTDYVQKPFMKTVQKAWAKEISICIPWEVVNEHSGIQLCQLVKDVIDGKIDFQSVFGNYGYGAKEYIAENPVEIVLP